MFSFGNLSFPKRRMTTKSLVFKLRNLKPISPSLWRQYNLLIMAFFFFFLEENVYTVESTVFVKTFICTTL